MEDTAQSASSNQQPATSELKASVSGAAASSRQPTSATLRPKPLVGIESVKGTWLSLGAYEEVLNSDFDYWAVTKELKSCDMAMTKLLRIHNRELQEQFEDECEKLKKRKPPGFELNVECLYHGTTAPLDMICAEGLDTRLSHKGHFGQGIYFSDNPEMCRAYCEDPDGSAQENFLVRCKVILGDQKIYKDGSFDPQLTREPQDATKKYDSVKGRVGQYNQFVIYDKRRAFIQYIVYYKTNRSFPIIPVVPTASKTKSRSAVTPLPSSSTASVGRADDERPLSDFSSDGESGGSRRSSISSQCSNGGGSGSEQKAEQTIAANVSNWTADEPTVPKVSITRKKAQQQSSGAQADPAITSATVSVAQPTTAAAGTAMAVSAQNLVSKSQDPHAVASNLQSVQHAAVLQLSALKNKIPDSQFEQLLTAFDTTYGNLFAQSSRNSSSQPTQSATSSVPAGGSANVFGDDDAVDPDIERSAYVFGDDDAVDPDVERVVDKLIDDFLSLTDCIDREIARHFIVIYDMDLDRAISEYYDAVFN